MNKQINITYIIPNYGGMFPIGDTVNFLLKIEHWEICTNSYTLNFDILRHLGTQSYSGQYMYSKEQGEKVVQVK